MEKHFHFLASKIDQRSKRERAYLLITLAFVLGGGWWLLVLEPYLLDAKEREDKVFQLRLLMDQHRQRKANILLNAKRNPDKENTAMLAAQERELETMEKQLEEVSRNLLSPDVMALVLEKLLKTISDMELVGLTTIPGEKLDLQSGGAAAPGDEPPPEDDFPGDDFGGKSPGGGGRESLYRHGLELSLKGDFRSAMDYLAALEHFPWTFYWDGIDFKGKANNRAEVKLTLNTLSISDGFLGSEGDGDPMGLGAPPSSFQPKAAPSPWMDPTLPAVVSATEAPLDDGEGEDENQGNDLMTMKLSSILLSKGRRVALLDGRPIMEGDEVKEAKVTRIDADRVVMTRNGREVELLLASKNQKWMTKNRSKGRGP